MEFVSYSWVEISILITAGILAGIVNTMAGSGTIFTFGAMLYLGIPITLANTTNRVGVICQNIAAIIAYIRNGQYSWKDLKLEFFLPTFLGAILGGVLAIEIPEWWLNLVASIVMLLLLPSMFKDVSWNLAGIIPSNKWFCYPLFFLIGLYGGFIQIGIGILLIVAISMYAQLSLLEANLNKLVIILTYTIPVTIFFAVKGMILWVPALLLSLGQIIGAYVTGVISNRWDGAELWMRRLLVVMILLTVIKIWFF